MPEHIVVIRPGALGDFILSLPVVAGLRLRYPRAHICVAARGGVVSLAEGTATAVADLDVVAGSIHNYINSGGFVIIWGGNSSNAYVPADFAGEILELPAQPPAGRPASRSWFEMVPQLAGVPYAPPRVCVRDEQLAVACGLLGSLPRPLVAVHPGSGGRGKCWPAAHFAKTIAILRASGRGVVLIEGEADADAVAQVQHETGETLPVLRHLPLRTLAAVLSRCNAYLGNDSGVSHLAAALGIPCTLIFGPTDPAVWAPENPGVRVMVADLPCRPCGSIRLQCTHRRCLLDIRPEKVAAQVLR